jgi:Restriction endonuclease
MPNYDFQSLSSYDFELLARDLIQAELGVRLESFAPGPDGGVDFRFRTAKGDIVVQCKHYKDYATLLRILTREEALKVRRLKPTRYILALSTPMTLRRKQAIYSLFAPYCADTSDILGREDLNNLLARHRSVEQYHMKLWLTSEPMLRRFLDRGVWGDSELTLNRIRQQARRYVPNPSFARAQEILNRLHYCIIVGIPGIGKTTLAEVLLIDYADRHDFQAIRIANDLSEIKEIKDSRRRQIFYYDDFLGTARLDKLEKNEDKRIIEFLQQVAANKRWRFILTTREYILNTAKIRYESLAQPTVELAPCIVDLADYTRPIRARILYNHIFFSDLPDPYKLELLERKRYSTILAHPNYNPRIIEHMTEHRNVKHIGHSGYFEEFLRNLAKPARIWDHAFRNDLSEAAQHTLLVLGSMPTPVLLSDLMVAFDKFYQYRRHKIGFATSSRDCEHALKELDGNFVKTDLVGEDAVIDFHNPSVNDYVEMYLAESPLDVADLVESVSFFDQLQQLWGGQCGKGLRGTAKYSEMFVAALSRNFLGPNCRIFRFFGQGGIVGMRRHSLPFEERMLFAVEVAQSLGTTRSQALIEKLTVLLIKRIEDRIAHKATLVEVLHTFDRRTKKSKSIFKSAKEFLTQTLNEYEDFDNVARFITRFPEIVDEDELARIRKNFKNFVVDYADVSERDPDLLRGVAEEITTVGTKLMVDVSEWAEPLFEKANEIESERPDEPEADDENRSWLDDSKALRDVDQMFEGLLREITERAS